MYTLASRFFPLCFPIFFFFLCLRKTVLNIIRADKWNAKFTASLWEWLYLKLHAEFYLRFTWIIHNWFLVNESDDTNSVFIVVIILKCIDRLMEQSFNGKINVYIEY